MRLRYPTFGKIIVDGKTYEHDIVVYFFLLKASPFTAGMQ